MNNKILISFIRKNLFDKVVLVVFLLLLSLFGTGCIWIKPIYFDDDKKLAQKKVEEFHQLYNDEKYREMYNLLSPKAQELISFENFSLAFNELRTNYGKVKKSKLVKEGIKPEASYRIVELRYETEFENYKANERIVLYVDGESAVIYYYDKPELISSN